MALAGCEFDGSDSLPGVPDPGLFMHVEAKRHQDEDTAPVAAAVFKDGNPVDLVGGDVFEASTATARILLSDRGLVTGSYAASIVRQQRLKRSFLY